MEFGKRSPGSGFGSIFLFRRKAVQRGMHKHAPELDSERLSQLLLSHSVYGHPQGEKMKKLIASTVLTIVLAGLLPAASTSAQNLRSMQVFEATNESTHLSMPLSFVFMNISSVR